MSGERGGRRADLMLAGTYAALAIIAAVLGALAIFAPETDSALVNTLVGFLTGIGGMFARNLGTAFDFEFGSSRSSREKDERLAGIAESQAKPPPRRPKASN
ncbi:MAG: hypothetical protein VYD87_16060 [Pseudomonadota bacterium]|nr:hypothetical protein [Pseudomonadota bacterium]